jgi:MFS family permease
MKKAADETGTSHTRAGRHAPMPSARYKWYLVGMLWWISFFNYADRQAIFSVFDLLEKEMGLSGVQLGLLGSSFNWVYGLCAPFAGRVVDRVRRKTAILAGLQAWSVICLATALSRRFSHLIFFRTAEGIGETFYYPASVSMISDYHGKVTRSRALGIHQTSVYAGTIGGGFFAGLIGQYYGWRWGFVVFGAMGMVLGLILSRWLIEPRRGAADEPEPGVPDDKSQTVQLPAREVLRIVCTTPTVLALMLGFLLANFGAMVLLSWMPKFLHDRFGFDLMMSGLNATLFPQLASMAGAPLGGWLADRWRQFLPGGRVLVQAGAVLAVAPFAYLCGRSESVFLLLTWLTAWGLFKGFYDANIFASVFDVIPVEARGTMAGFMNMTGWLAGGAPAPVIIGYLRDLYGLGPAISATAIVYVAASLVLATAGLVFVKRDAARLAHASFQKTIS